ncbi:HAD-IIA family hydrolase [Amycolatopsis alkalitolerans]|nr:HAD-IIA family hydrolase [Amycolatopsis alkalitolerans]
MAVLIDIDGVLTLSWRPLPGAVEALRRLREDGQDFALLTNTTSRTRASIAAVLVDGGFPVGTEDIFTAPVLTGRYLRAHYPDARCFLLNSGDIADDLDGVRLVEDEPEVVVVGGAGPEFGYPELNRVFGFLQAGAKLVAMHRNLYWRTDAGLQLDTGAFLLGLERAAGVEAEIVGKPAEAFFVSALAALDASPAGSFMIGDDIEADVLAAQACGLTGVLVRTGKYRPETDTGEADHVVGGFGDVPELIRRSPRS